MNEYKALIQKEMGLFTDLEFTTMEYPKIKDKELSTHVQWLYRMVRLSLYRVLCVSIDGLPWLPQKDLYGPE